MSATGKDTILHDVQSMLYHNPPCGTIQIQHLIPFTTREKRIGEVNGVDYIFIEEAELELARDQIMEMRSYNTKTPDGDDIVRYYGHFIPEAEYSIAVGPIDFYAKIKDTPGVTVVPYYLQIPEEERLLRLVKREAKQPNPNWNEIVRRFYADSREFDPKIIYDLDISFALINKDRVTTVMNIASNITSVIEKNEIAKEKMKHEHL
jgi:guanylate kinase